MLRIYKNEEGFQSEYNEIISEYLKGNGLSDEDIRKLEKLRNNPFVNTTTSDWRVMKLLLEIENKYPSIPLYCESNIENIYKNQTDVKNKTYTLEKCYNTSHIKYPILQYRNSEDVLYLIKTSPGAPEEYDVLNSHFEKIGRIRIRHGKFRVDYITHGETKTIHTKLFNNKYKGSLELSEWVVYIPLACELIINHIHHKK